MWKKKQSKEIRQQLLSNEVEPLPVVPWQEEENAQQQSPPLEQQTEQREQREQTTQREQTEQRELPPIQSEDMQQTRETDKEFQLLCTIFPGLNHCKLKTTYEICQKNLQATVDKLLEEAE